MNYFLAGVLGVLLVANAPAAETNAARRADSISAPGPATNDPVEIEFRKVMEADDVAHDEVDGWIKNRQSIGGKGAGETDEALNQRILARFEIVRKSYDDFLVAHPNHARAHLAYAGFLQEIKQESAGVAHMETARKLDPTNPAAWNNLANYYGHYGDVKIAFEYYTKAIELNPEEPVYYHNFGTTVYLYRHDAMEFYGINEQQVFDKALQLYSNAMRLEPQDFPLASDVAQTYYGIKPLRVTAALQAWTNALALAHDDIERQGVYVHFARLNWMAGRTNEARAYIGDINMSMYAELKRRLTANLDRTYTDGFYTNALDDPSPAVSIERKSSQ